MTLYEINAITVNYNGFVNGRTNIARTINPNKIDELIKNYREAHQKHQWWMRYKQDENKNIKVEINEYEVIE